VEEQYNILKPSIVAQMLDVKLNMDHGLHGMHAHLLVTTLLTITTLLFKPDQGCGLMVEDNLWPKDVMKMFHVQVHGTLGPNMVHVPILATETKPILQPK